MKAAQLALRKHAPSVAVLGTAALVALDYSNKSSSLADDASSSVREVESKSVPGTSSSDAAASRIIQPPPQILATSDASAEQSASVAAATRFSPARPIMAEAVATNSSSFKTTGIFERKVAENNNNNNSSDNKKHGNNSKSNTPEQPQDGCQEECTDDSYPTFTPYHNSLLKEYLTPDVWKKLSSRTTSFGTTAEDIIRAGVSLPIGASPPRRVGVLVGDAECYSVFKELLEPIISHYHGIKSYEEWVDPELPMESHFKATRDEDNRRNSSRSSSSNSNNTAANDDSDVIKSGAGSANDDFLLDDDDEEISPPSRQQKPNLRRHCTIINNPNLVRLKADPEGKYILSTRVRVARSLDGVRFPATMSRSDRRKVERLIHDCTKNFQASNLSNGVYLPVLSMTNDQNLDLIERHILFDNPNEWTIASGLGRDWPDGRAIYANVSDIQSQTPDFMIWINEEDHLRVMTLKKGGDIQGAFTSLMNGVRELERELGLRGWKFAKDPRLGYLVSCPTNVGTTM